MSFMRGFVRSYKVFFIGVSLLSLGFFENKASAHIYQISSLRMKNGKIVIFLKDAHHYNLILEGGRFGLSARALQERADLEGRQVYGFLNQLLSNGLKINLLVEKGEAQADSKSKDRSESEEIFNLDTYLAISGSSHNVRNYDLFDYIQVMTFSKKVENFAIQGQFFKLHGFDNRSEKERAIIKQFGLSLLRPTDDNFREIRRMLQSVDRDFEHSIHFEIQSLIERLERLFPEEHELLARLRARQASFLDLSISKWVGMSFEEWRAGVSEIRNQFNDWTNLKVDLSLLLHILTGEGPVVIIHGGGLHLDHALEFLSFMSGVDQFSSKIGYDNPQFLNLFKPENTFGFETAVKRSLMEIAHCPVCLKKTDQLLKCARCREEAYCGPVCQKKAWPKHKLQCKPASVAPQGGATDSGAGAAAGASEVKE